MGPGTDGARDHEFALTVVDGLGLDRIRELMFPWSIGNRRASSSKGQGQERSQSEI